MKATFDKILVSVDDNQKDTVAIGGNIFQTANQYETNFRVKSPTIATVVEGNEQVRKGDVILCHHNLFYLPSPYHLYDNVFSVPFSKVLFAKVLLTGDLLPICGNILGEEVMKTYLIPVPDDQKEKYKDRILVTDGGYTRYKKGQLLFTRPSAPYNIVYTFNGEQRQVTKISEDMVTGYYTD